MDKNLWILNRNNPKNVRKIIYQKAETASWYCSDWGPTHDFYWTFLSWKIPGYESQAIQKNLHGQTSLHQKKNVQTKPTIFYSYFRSFLAFLLNLIYISHHDFFLWQEKRGRADKKGTTVWAKSPCLKTL